MTAVTLRCITPLVMVALLSLGGCAFDARGKDRCRTDADCLGSQTCEGAQPGEKGRCVPGAGPGGQSCSDGSADCGGEGQCAGEACSAGDANPPGSEVDACDFYDFEDVLGTVSDKGITEREVPVTIGTVTYQRTGDGWLSIVGRQHFPNAPFTSDYVDVSLKGADGALVLAFGAPVARLVFDAAVDTDDDKSSCEVRANDTLQVELTVDPERINTVGLDFASPITVLSIARVAGPDYLYIDNLEVCGPGDQSSRDGAGSDKATISERQPPL